MHDTDASHPLRSYSWAHPHADFVTHDDARGNRYHSATGRRDLGARDSLLDGGVHHALAIRFRSGKSNDRPVRYGITSAIMDGIGPHQHSCRRALTFDAQIAGFGRDLLHDSTS